MKKLNLAAVHSSWLPLIQQALNTMSPAYLLQLEQNSDWLPGPESIFNAFSLPLNNTNYILLGESPYPRALSANGYAFWDNAVNEIWSPQGLSKTVNRATSLRNFIKMLLVTGKYLTENDTSQPAIVSVDKTSLILTAADLFGNMQEKGFLLLNASLVLSSQAVKLDAAAWQPFMISLFQQIYQLRPQVQVILLGKIASVILGLCPYLKDSSFIAEHPYNLSFISNPAVLAFFKPFNFLERAKSK